MWGANLRPFLLLSSSLHALFSPQHSPAPASTLPVLRSSVTFRHPAELHHGQQCKFKGITKVHGAGTCTPEPQGRWQLCEGSWEVEATAWDRDLLPPAAYLRYCDAAFLCQLFFGFFTGVGVTEVRVKILIQDFCGLFTEVTPFPSEMRKENHICSSRCKQDSGRVSRGGRDPCLIRLPCSHTTALLSTTDPFRPALHRGWALPSCHAQGTPGHNARHPTSSPARDWTLPLTSRHPLLPGFHPVCAEATSVCCGRTHKEVEGEAGRWAACSTSSPRYARSPRRNLLAVKLLCADSSLMNLAAVSSRSAGASAQHLG